MVRICARALLLMATLFVLLGGRAGLVAQQPPAPAAQAPGQPPGGGRGGPQPPKNIQVLKDVPPDQINLTMQYIAASLGVQCNYCHVQGQNDSDDKETKKIARDMMKMVDKLNGTFFDGKPRVSCASCHNGRSKPVRTPPLAIDMTAEQAAAAAAGRGRGGRGGPGGPAGAPAAVGAPVAGGAPTGPGGQGRGVAEPPPPPVPTESVDDVVAKYVQALGGEQAVQNAKTRVMTGTVTTRDLVTSNVTVQEKSSGAYRIDIATQPTPTTRATNGTAAWAIGGGGRGGGGGAGGAAPEARDLAGFQMQQGLRLADFALPLSLKTRYSSLLVNKAYDTIDGKQVVVVTGTAFPNVTEQLSFSRESGLLLRRVITTGSGGVGYSIMNLPEQIDYSDYRDVGGLKVAHTVRHATWNQVTTERFTDVKINAPVADDVFTKPAPK
jgi:photosynthetic reaction center cytochrome c subunit